MKDNWVTSLARIAFGRGQLCRYLSNSCFATSSQQVERKRDMGIKILFFNFVKVLDLLEKHMTKFITVYITIHV